MSDTYVFSDSPPAVAMANKSHCLAGNKPCAFTLIELMIYLALLAGLSLLVFDFAARTYRFVIERTHQHTVFVRAMVTGDLICRDLRVASPWAGDSDFAKKIFKQLTMTADGKPIEVWVGYEVDEKGLKRREGAYTPGTGAWAESTVALVNAHVIRVNMQPIIDQRAAAPRGTVAAVTVTMTVKLADKEKEFGFTVALRNRVLP